MSIAENSIIDEGLGKLNLNLLVNKPISEKNREVLIGIVKYITQKRIENVIDEKQFDKVVKIAFSNYFENEFGYRFNKSFNSRFLQIIGKS